MGIRQVLGTWGPEVSTLLFPAGRIYFAFLCDKKLKYVEGCKYILVNLDWMLGEHRKDNQEGTTTKKSWKGCLVYCLSKEQRKRPPHSPAVELSKK